jgi:hypothetical protein
MGGRFVEKRIGEILTSFFKKGTLLKGKTQHLFKERLTSCSVQ